ncbi:SRPBCC family protein [Nonomuraea sp. NBC_00507]|uniref:SRPBCC family protein n=1 Tax=Nonomuraea sp. NBC_00507 TaxID=2976002 RepID=UPI002E193CCF
MTEISAAIIVAAPAERVWQVVAHHFAQVDAWATAVRSSHPLPEQPIVPGAPVAGRVCRTGLPGLSQVTERIVAYDEAAMTLTYEARLLPGLIPQARNRWEVVPIGDTHSRVSTQGSVQTQGIPGMLLYLLLRPFLTLAGRRFLRDLRRHVDREMSASG